MKDKPITTLFLLTSLDGKINSGSQDCLDVDKDWCQITGVKEGLQQYYDIEATTDFYSLNTGRVMAKIGINEKMNIPNKLSCRFIIIDNKPHLNQHGIDYLCRWVDRLILVTTCKHHEAYGLQKKYTNLDILSYDTLNLNRLLIDMKEKYSAKAITIQSGGSLNGLFLRENLIDYVHLVVAPLLVGGKDTPTMIDGTSIRFPQELHQLKALEYRVLK